MASRADRRLRWLGFGLLGLFCLGELAILFSFGLPVCVSDCGDYGGRGLFIVAVAGCSLVPVGALLVSVSSQGPVARQRGVLGAAMLALVPTLVAVAVVLGLVAVAALFFGLQVAFEGLSEGEPGALAFAIVFGVPAAGGCLAFSVASLLAARSLARGVASLKRVRRELRRVLLALSVPALAVAASGLRYAVAELEEALRLLGSEVADPAFDLPQAFAGALGFAGTSLGAAGVAVGAILTARRLGEEEEGS